MHSGNSDYIFDTLCDSPPASECWGDLILPCDRREKSRLVTELPQRGQVLIRVPRGLILRGGQYLNESKGRGHLAVRAAKEAISLVSCEPEQSLARVAYHLGNRHVPVQLFQNALAYRQDSVLDKMVTRLGYTVRLEQQAFEPEPGAYGTGHAHVK